MPPDLITTDNTALSQATEQARSSADGQGHPAVKGYVSEAELFGAQPGQPETVAPQATEQAPAETAPASDLAGTHGDIKDIVASAVQETMRAMLPLFERLVPAKSEPTAPAAPAAPRGPAVGDVHAIALQAARGALGEHASDEALADYARQYIAVTRLEGFKDAKGWDTPEAKAQIEAARDQFRRYDAQARENAALRAELRELRAKIEAPKPVPRNELLAQNVPDLEGYLKGFAWTDPQTGRRVEDASAAQFPLVSKMARGGPAHMKAVIERIHARLPSEVDAAGYSSAIIQALSILEADARAEIATREQAQPAQTTTKPAPAAVAPTNPGQGGNGAMQTRQARYVTDEELGLG